MNRETMYRVEVKRRDGVWITKEGPLTLTKAVGYYEDYVGDGEIARVVRIETESVVMQCDRPSNESK